jgi:CRISPR/Cas system-associated exonuclease Cas4 (RecB family)
MEKQTLFNFKKEEDNIQQETHSLTYKPIIKPKRKDKITLSPSTLNIFRDCPRCFWLHINCGIKRPRGAFPSIASGLDGVIKEYFGSYRKDGVLPPLLKNKIEGKLIPQLPNKLFFSDNAKNALLMGMLDECLILPDNTYAPLDYKTRRSFPQDTHPAYQLQMDLYTLLLEKNNYKTNSIGYLLYFVPGYGKLHEGIPFEVKLIEVKTSLARALDVFHRATELLKDSMPVASENCEYCNWLKQMKESNE